MFQNIYQRKRVLVTGHSGFKGFWLSLWLAQMGAEVHGCGFDNDELWEIICNAFDQTHFTDINDLSAVLIAMNDAKPDIIFHLAAQPLVRKSYELPIDTLTTNVIGTANVLEAVHYLKLPCPVIIVTSDKCYENFSDGSPYVETDPLGGHDVYSASKACAEIITNAWRRSFFTPGSGLGPVATVRAGNVIGGGDYAPDRIVPDCIRALSAEYTIKLRNPDARRPWQHVLDCLSGYLLLGQKLLDRPTLPCEYATAFNFGPDDSQTVETLVKACLKHWQGKYEVIPQTAAPHEAHTLALNTQKAHNMLDWHPVWSFDQSVNYTMDWYRRRHVYGDAPKKMLANSKIQIQDFEAAAIKQNLPWTK